MSNTDLLAQVKIRLGITGTFQDDLLSAYILDVKEFLKDAGVPEAVINSNASLGVISRGVSDTWNYGTGDGKFSKMFFQRAEQLRRSSVTSTDEFADLENRVEEIETFLDGKSFLIAD